MENRNWNVMKERSDWMKCRFLFEVKLENEVVDWNVMKGAKRTEWNGNQF